MDAHMSMNANPSVWLLYLIDGSILIFGILSLIYLRKMVVGIRLSKTLIFVGVGMVAIAINHFVDFLFIHDFFGDTLIFGAPASSFIHHLGNLVGFLLILIGYLRASKILLAKAVVYTGLVATLSGGYVFLYVIITRDYFHSRDLHSDHEVLLAFATLVIAFLYQPLRRIFTKAVNRFFLRYSYDTEEFIKTISQLSVSTYKLDVLSDELLKAIVNGMRLSFADIVLVGNGKFYNVRRYGSKGTPNYSYENLELLEKQNKMLVYNQLDAITESEQAYVKNVMGEFDVMAISRLQTSNNFVGFLMLGGKATGEILTLQDIQTLEIITSEISIAIANAKAVSQIENFNAYLQDEVKSATAELQAANDRLQRLDDSKDEFISMASHQLRTPLTTVKGYLSMMLDGDMGKVPDGLKNAMQIAYTSSQRMVYLIADMLNVSRINTGKLVYETKPVDIVKIVESEIEQLQTQASVRKVKIVFNKPIVALPRLVLDEQKIGQVVMNMMDNSIYYAPNTTIIVDIGIVNNKIRFTISDQGIGIPITEQAQLFTKFFRATNAKKIRPDGTGLGLYMAKTVVEALGGSVLFSSQEGTGSVFGFEFPLPSKSSLNKDLQDNQDNSDNNPSNNQ